MNIYNLMIVLAVTKSRLFSQDPEVLQDPGVLDAVTFGNLLVAIETLGIDRAHAVLSAGAWVINPFALKGMAPADLEDPHNEDHQKTVARIRRILEAVQATAAQWPEDEVLRLTYIMLRTKSMTHAEASELASVFLKKPVSTDAWRMRINRWAEAQGYPKVELYKRQASETNN